MAELRLYDRTDLETLFRCSKRSAQRKFWKIYDLIPKKLRTDEHKKFLPEYYLNKYLGVPSDTKGK